SEPGTPDGRQDAGVLILLDGTPEEYRVFLCIRSDEMRRHPGEVCFPGGMRDADENLQETAIREAEEVGQIFEKKNRSSKLGFVEDGINSKSKIASVQAKPSELECPGAVTPIARHLRNPSNVKEDTQKSAMKPGSGAHSSKGTTSV
ncbi:hypothetical protein GCK32_020531, partial [Trichostrongylus colubriformis]